MRLWTAERGQGRTGQEERNDYIELYEASDTLYTLYTLFRG